MDYVELVIPKRRNMRAEAQDWEQRTRNNQRSRGGRILTPQLINRYHDY